MHRLELLSTVPSVLCLGAHGDDIEIGCGGLLLHLVRCNPSVEVTWVVLSGDEQRADEVRTSARALCVTGRPARVEVQHFRDGYFPYVAAEIKEYFEALSRQVAPTVILTHRHDDAHQDHRLVCELTWNTFRSHLILEYEVPKYDGDLGRPNVYLPLDTSTVRRKVEHLERYYRSQRHRPWFSAETFMALMRLRGIECASASGYAEGFYGRKVVLR